MNIKEVHDRARKGDHINDEELKALIVHFTKLRDLMFELMWEPYQLVTSDVYMELRRYEGYQQARKER